MVIKVKIESNRRTKGQSPGETCRKYDGHYLGTSSVIFLRLCEGRKNSVAHKCERSFRAFSHR